MIGTWGKVSNITENLFSVANQPVEDVEEQVLDRNADVLTTGIFNISILQMPTNDWYGEGGWCATFCTTSGYASPEAFRGTWRGEWVSGLCRPFLILNRKIWISSLFFIQMMDQKEKLIMLSGWRMILMSPATFR